MTSSISGLPLKGTNARRIITNLLRERDFWPRADLIKAVVQTHTGEGGVLGVQDPTLVVKKALSDLKEQGVVFSPSNGLWALVGNINSAPASPAIAAPTIQAAAQEEQDAEDTEEPQGKTIGAGDEAVYVYYNPSDFELAQLKQLEVWPCKVGMTTVLPVTSRILAQGVKTAFARAPAIGLIVLTDNAYRLEQALHHALHIAGAECPESLGTEWFMTNPDKVQAWCENFSESLRSLRI